MTIGEMRDFVFCDAVAMVLSWVPSPHGHQPRGDLYIADWTENSQLYAFDREAAAGRAGGNWPVGQRAMQVTVYGHEMEPFERFSGEQVVGRMVHVTNLGPRMNPNGLLEGRVSDKVRGPGERRLIRFLNEGEYKKERDAIIERLVKCREEQAAEVQRAAEMEMDQAEVAGPEDQAEPSAEESESTATAAVGPEPETVSAPPAAQPVAEPDKDGIKPVVSSPPTPPPEQERRPTHTPHLGPATLDSAQLTPAATTPAALGPTQRVHYVPTGLPLASMGTALTDAAESGRFRLRARIVDFTAARLQDWIMAQCGECKGV